MKRGLLVPGLVVLEEELVVDALLLDLHEDAYALAALGEVVSLLLAPHARIVHLL